MSSPRIAYPDNPIMAAAWAGSVSWCAREPDARAAFKAATGHDLINVLGARGIALAIDEATGHGRAVMDAFVDWHNEMVWGENPFVPAEAHA